MIDVNEGPRAVRSLPVEYWFSRPRRRRSFVVPIAKLAGWTLVATIVAIAAAGTRWTEPAPFVARLLICAMTVSKWHPR
jgi:hypothetical protein